MNDRLGENMQKTLTGLEPARQLLRKQQQILDSLTSAVKVVSAAARLQIPTASKLAGLKAQTALELAGFQAQTALELAGFKMPTISKLVGVKIPTALELASVKMPPTLTEHLRIFEAQGVTTATATGDYLNSLIQTLRENLLAHPVNSSLVNPTDLTKYLGVTELLQPLKSFEEQAKAMSVAALGYDAVHLTAFSAIHTVTEQFKFVQANVESHNQLFNFSLYHFLTDLDELNSEEFETEEDKFEALVERVAVVFQTLLEKIQDNPSDFVLRAGYHILITFIYRLILFSLSAASQQVQ